ncbi:MAG: DUF6345 domain-containing protein [bacterium]
MRIHPQKFVLCFVFSCIIIFLSVSIKAANHNWEHEIMVYSLEEYGQFYDCIDNQTVNWKGSVYVTDARDPYYDFWNEMNCSGPECMHVNSIRRRNNEVTVNNMVAPHDAWSDADLVFFYGHNTQIQPQRFYSSFSLWRPAIQCSLPTWGTYGYCWQCWTQVTLPDWQVWGTSDEPYRYHTDLISDASLTNAYAVFYAYNPLTSVLIGKDFTGGTWHTENTYNQSSADAHSGKLGDDDTEWIIAHGCNAVTVADYNSSGDVVGIPLGVKAWKKSWSRLHTVMGHYYSTYTSMEPDLNVFAAALKAGDVIKDAYFDAHNGIGNPSNPALGQPAAISKSRISCCISWGGYWPLIYCPPSGCSRDYMHSETWTDPMPDNISNNKFYYITSWRVCE